MSSPHLLSLFDLRGIPLRNRVVMAPLTRGRAGRERVPNDLMVEYYTQRASAGLSLSEATMISEQANGWADSQGVTLWANGFAQTTSPRAGARR